MIYSNAWLMEFIGYNWMALLIIYGVLKAMYPNSKILNSIGQGFSNIFPVFRRKAKDQ